MPSTRLGIVRFLNTLPLVDGLEALADLELVPEVPSHLIDTLLAGRVDLALCSSIDAQRCGEDMVVLPAGLLGADGESLTVRLFSRTEAARVAAVHCDTDSHTSVALLRVLLAERHDIAPELIPHRHGAGRLADAEAVLLIGDKVVTDAPALDDFPHRIDLGAAWVELTGLPFVFALWIARATTPAAVLERAFTVLDRQRRANALRIPAIVARQAASFGWPADLARTYLERHITFETTPRRLEGLTLFYELAARHGIIDAVRPLVFRPALPAQHAERDAIEACASTGLGMHGRAMPAVDVMPTVARAASSVDPGGQPAAAV